MTTTLERPAKARLAEMDRAGMQDAGPQLVLPLTENEVSTLRRCEAVIEEGRVAFLRVGSALKVIQENRLYRLTHPSFEDYLGDRWKIGKTNAYRMMSAVDVVRAIEEAGAPVSPIGEAVLPANEAQARPLSALPEERQAEAWAEAVEQAGGQPTGAEVQAVVDTMLPPRPVKDTPPTQEQLFDASEQGLEDKQNIEDKAGREAQNGLAPPGPVAAGEAGRPNDMTDEEWEASAKPAASGPSVSADTIQPLAPEGDTNPPVDEAPAEAADAARMGITATPMTRPEPAPKPAAPNPAAPAAPITPPAPALPPGWTTAMVKVADFEAAKAMGLWPLVNAIGVVEELRTSLEELRAALTAAEGELSALRAEVQSTAQDQGVPETAHPETVAVETSPAMAIAAGAAGILADMIRTSSQEVLTPTDTQILDELFPAREQTLPEHIVATLLTKRLRQARGENATI